MAIIGEYQEMKERTEEVFWNQQIV